MLEIQGILVSQIKAMYHSYQDCPIDFHMLHSKLFHDHEIVPQLFHGLCVTGLFT